METDNRTRSGTTTNNNGFESGILRPCTALLSRRDFTVCRQLAKQISRSDPDISAQLDRIIAISNVLTAASRRLGPTKSHPDHYSILNLSPSDASNRDLVRQQFKTLVRLLDPNKNKFPFAVEALMRAREAWTVLSDPILRDRFDREIRGDGSTGASTLSFWTMCPYCWYLHEYERKYEDCTFRCGNCGRTFHGAEVKPPSTESVVEGKEQYYCYHVSLPLRYPLEERSRFEVGGNGRKRMRVKTVANRVRMKGFFVPDNDSDLEM